MKNDSRVTVNILDKEYQVACRSDERESLLRAARELDSRMRKVRNSGGVVGSDRIAVMVGLNLCYELQQAESNQPGDTVPTRVLENIVNRLDSALETTR